MTVNTNVGPQYQLTFAYDSKGRRIQKVVATNGVAISTNKFLYDGWNLIAETGPNNSPIRSYVWGTDLSGSAQDAGGVGGLLEVNYYGSATTNSFPAFDGNGNVAALVNAADGTTLANYEYGPFGEPIRITSSMAKNNPFRFSTKYQDDESDLLYYGYRYYKPSTGSWLSRDQADSENNPYLFTKNNALSAYDSLGLWGEQVHRDDTTQWARQLGIDYAQSQNIGVFNNFIDTIYDPKQINNKNWSWHFDRSVSGNERDDSRLQHRDEELAKAKKMCTNPTDEATTAAAFIGRALHPLQDWVAHGDFNRRLETPTLTGVEFPETLHYWHNFDAGGPIWGFRTAWYPDDPTLDADGTDVDSRASFVGGQMHRGTILSNGDTTYWTTFHTSSRRIRKTEQLTKDLLSDFQDYVRAYGKPCGNCQKAFLGGN